MLAFYILSIILCTHGCLGSPQHVMSYLFDERVIDDNGRITLTCDKFIIEDFNKSQAHLRHAPHAFLNSDQGYNYAIFDSGCQVDNGVISEVTCSALVSNPADWSCSSRWGCYNDGEKCADLPNFPNTEITRRTRLKVSIKEIDGLPGYYGMAVYDGKKLLNFDILTADQWTNYLSVEMYSRKHKIEGMLKVGDNYVGIKDMNIRVHTMALLGDETMKESEARKNSDTQPSQEDSKQRTILKPIRKLAKSVFQSLTSKIKKMLYDRKMRKTNMQRFETGKHTVLEYEHILWLVEDGHARRLDKSIVPQLY